MKDYLIDSFIYCLTLLFCFLTFIPNFTLHKLFRLGPLIQLLSREVKEVQMAGIKIPVQNKPEKKFFVLSKVSTFQHRADILNK